MEKVGLRRMDESLNLEQRGMGNTLGEEKWKRDKKGQRRKESSDFTLND